MTEKLIGPRRVSYEEDSRPESPFFKIINGKLILVEPDTFAAQRSGTITREYLIDQEEGRILVLPEGYILPENPIIHPGRFYPIHILL